MSDDEPLKTPVYKKSPKASKRTTFQDELEEAVSARARRNAGSHSYTDDFEDDDVLSEILNRRRKKLETFRKGKKKQAKVQEFQLSDEEENAKPKKVSFLKSRKTSSPLEGRHIEKAESEKGDTANGISSTLNDSSQSNLSSGKSERGQGHSVLTSQPEGDPSAYSSQLGQAQSETVGEFSPQWGESESTQSKKDLVSQNGRGKVSASALFNSGNRQRDFLSPEVTEAGQRVFSRSTESGEHDKTVVSGSQDPPLPYPRERSAKEKSTTGPITEEGPPKPKPRQRTLRAGSPVVDRPVAESPPNPVLSISVPVLQSPTKGADTTPTSPPGNGAAPSYGPQESEDRPDGAVSRQSNASGKTYVIRPSSAQPFGSRKSGRGSSCTAKSKYLGSLKVLDQQLPDKDSQPEAADSLRAAIYQEWLQKKQEKLQAELRAKRQEEKLKEEKKREEEQSKKAQAKASYDAWKEMKRDTIRMKIKDKQESVRKQEREMSEKEEKKETAKKVFEKWKQDQDEILKEKIRKQSQTENKLKQKKEMEKEDKKKDAIAAFSKWSETKKDVIQEKIKTERKKLKIKQEEEQYEKEERDQLALEMYEKWMKRKEFQEKRERNEKRIQAILQDEPRPPWSPPNKTVPSGK